MILFDEPDLPPRRNSTRVVGNSFDLFDETISTESKWLQGGQAKINWLELVVQLSPWVVSGCGSNGRAVASDTIGPRFESSHRQNFRMNILLLTLEKTKIKIKRPGMAHWKYHLWIFCSIFSSEWEVMMKPQSASLLEYFKTVYTPQFYS